MKQFSLTTTINQAAPIFGAAALSGLAFFGMPGTAMAADIGPGIDRVVTQEGTFFDFGGPIGRVEFMGAGGADTWIERKEDCDFDDKGKCHVDIEVIKLELISVASVNIGDLDYQISVGLNKDAPSVGEMWINDDGTFNSDFEVNFVANLIPLDGGPIKPIPIPIDPKKFSGNTNGWTFDPDGNLRLNGLVRHTAEDIDQAGGIVGNHIVKQPVPEPLTTLASVTGLAFGGMLKRKNDKKNKKQQKA